MEKERIGGDPVSGGYVFMRAMIPWSRMLVLFLWGLAMGVPVLLHAQDEEPFAETTEVAPKKKRPSLFHRPARDSAEAQMAYAESLRQEGRRRAALRAYNALVHQWPGAPEAPAAQAAYAALLYEARKYRRAFDEYQYLVDNYVGHFLYEDVLAAQFRIANLVRSHRRLQWLFFPGFSAPERALPLLEQIIKNAPNWDRTPSVQFSIGVIHEANGDLAEAIEAYGRVTHRYPDDPLAATAEYRKAVCFYEFASRQPRDEKTCREALSALTMFLTQTRMVGPERDQVQAYADQLKDRLAGMYYERAEYYDKIVRKPLAATIAYRDFIKNFPSSPLVGKAGERMDELKMQLENQDETQKQEESPSGNR